MNKATMTKYPEKSQSGFTLIEVMMVVVIVAILVAVAVPVYSSQVEKGRLADAQAALTQNGHYMERWYADHGRYTKTATTWPTLPVTKTDYYNISFASTASSTTGNTYMLEARRIQNGANAKFLKLDQDGNVLVCTGSGSTEQCSLNK